MSARRFIPASPWESFEFVRTKSRDGVSIELSRYGLFADLDPLQPNKGATLDGYNLYEVESSTLTRRQGGMGLLKIVLVATDPSLGRGETTIDRKVSVRWQQVEKPLFDGYYTTQGSSLRISFLNAWRHEPSATLREEFKFRNPVVYGEGDAARVQYEIAELSKEEQAIAKREDGGQTGSMFFYPVVSCVEVATHAPRSMTGKYAQPPYVILGSTLAAWMKRKWVPNEAPGGGFWAFLCTKCDLTDQGGKTVQIEREWQGGLPPTGKLSDAWDGEAFDTLFYGNPLESSKKKPAAPAAGEKAAEPASPGDGPAPAAPAAGGKAAEPASPGDGPAPAAPAAGGKKGRKP
jgi:hypothetical protein